MELHKIQYENNIIHLGDWCVQKNKHCLGFGIGPRTSTKIYNGKLISIKHYPGGPFSLAFEGVYGYCTRKLVDYEFSTEKEIFDYFEVLTSAPTNRTISRDEIVNLVLDAIAKGQNNPKVPFNKENQSIQVLLKKYNILKTKSNG